MTRVLLFVQTGDGRPKCYAATEALVTKEWVEGNGSGFVDSHFTLAEKNGADRWWLVECENAEAGRQIIGAGGPVTARHHVGKPIDRTKTALYALPDGMLHEGRILASGGKT